MQHVRFVRFIDKLINYSFSCVITCVRVYTVPISRNTLFDNVSRKTNCLEGSSCFKSVSFSANLLLFSRNVLTFRRIVRK